MNKLGKIAPVIVILACLGSGFFGYELQVMKKAHLGKIAELTDSYNTTSAELTSTKKTLKRRRVN